MGGHVGGCRLVLLAIRDRRPSRDTPGPNRRPPSPGAPPAVIPFAESTAPPRSEGHGEHDIAGGVRRNHAVGSGNVQMAERPDVQGAPLVVNTLAEFVPATVIASHSRVSRWPGA